MEDITISDILGSYDRTRMRNKRILQERQDEVYKKIPQIKELDTDSATSYIKAARERILGNQDSEFVAETGKKNRENTALKKKLLVEHGYSGDYLDPIYDCSICRDTGYVGTDKCKCFLDRIIDSLYLSSNIKNILEVENFSNFKTEYYSRTKYGDMQYTPYENINNIIRKSKEYIENFSKNPKGNILIYGETGLGKTFLTNCIAKELLDRGHSVLYLSANQLFETVLSGYLLNKKFELEDLYKYIYNSELLVIDDLGTEFTNNFVLSQLFEIINQRSCLGRATLISTNLSIQQLRDRYSERIMSRIVDNYTVFYIYGDNIRYQKRRNTFNSN